MYSLRIFGPAELTGPGGTSVQSVLKQPKRTALLAYLAMAPSGTRTRSEVVELFWSDRGAEERRHALSQALYYLRRSLSKSAITVEGDVLRLEPELFETDIAQFRTLLEEGRLAEAVAHCRGDLLQGFPAVPGFDHWLDEAREGLRQQALRALERLSLDAEAAGDHDLAIQWAERGHELAPYHEAPLRRLLSTLLAASEPVRAREVYDRFAAHLRADLDMEPSPETTRILDVPPPSAPGSGQAAAGGPPPAADAARNPTDPAPPAGPLPTMDGVESVPPGGAGAGGRGATGARAGSAAAPVGPEGSAPSVPGEGATVPPGEGAAGAPVPRAGSAAGPPAGIPGARAGGAAGTPVAAAENGDPGNGGGRLRDPSRVWTWRALAAAALAAVIFGAFDYAFVSEPSAEVEAALPGSRVGIFPFIYRGSAELGYLGDGIAELISISIHSLDQVTTLDPRALAGGSGSQALPAPEAATRARALGAEHFVVGSVVEAGGQIQVTARLHRSDGNLVGAVSGRASSDDDLFELVDDLVRQLVASEAFPGASDLERAAALTSGSLPALRHFLRGERLFREGSYRDAVGAFDEAVREDSTFALALYRSAVASIWSNDADFDGARSKVDRALMHRDRVSGIEGDLFLALDEFLRGRLLPAERLYESVLLRQPENIEAWFQLGEARFHYGALHGRGVDASGEAWRRVIALNPDHRPALIHLSAVAASRADPELAVLEDRIGQVGEAPMRVPQVQALRVFSSESEAERTRFIEELGRHRPGAVSSTAAYASRYLRSPSAGARIARIMTDPARPPAERADGHLLLAHFELAMGRPEAARRELEHARQLDSLRAESHRLLLATLPAVPVELRSSGDGVVDAALRVDVHGDVGRPVDFDGSVESAMRVYGRALVYHRAGGEDGALLAAALRLQDPPDDPGDGALLRSLSRGLVAERHLAQGDAEAARAELTRSILDVERWYEHLRADYLRSVARERFLLAESEIATGGDDRAESMLAPLGDNSVAELPYLGPGLIRIGEIRERTGDAVGAAEAYRRALDLWSDAEPILDPLRAELEGRIEALGRSLDGTHISARPGSTSLRP